MSKQSIIFAGLIIVLILLGVLLYGANSRIASEEPKLLVIHVPEVGQLRCDITTPKYISLPADKNLNLADFALKSLFAEGLPKIQSYYKGVTVRGDVAVVDFDKQALQFLNGSPCMQESYKAPISRTLNELGIKEVEYSIDGTIFNEWDA